MRDRLIDWALPGNIVPPVTPFDEDGLVDYDALTAEIDYVIAAARPAAVCVAGVEAQEYQYLSEPARHELIREAVAAIDGRAPALVGISHSSFRRAVELAALAESLGACAVQLLIPNRPSGGPAPVKEIVAYFERIAREIALPIVAYHNPNPGAEVGLGALLEILALDRVVALKESSRNQRFLGRLIQEANTRELAHVFTTMEVLFPTLLLGASGGTMPPPGAAISALLVEAFAAGDLATAAELHALHSEMPARWVDHGLVAVMKASLRALGLECGEPYPPFGAVPPAHEREIASFWEAAQRRFPALRYESAKTPA